MENFINRIDLRLVSNEIDSLNKMDIKTKLYVKKIFDKDLVAICKKKLR